MEELSLRDGKKTKDVIGFNDNHVFTISEANKKPDGSAELYKDLDYDDFCVDFTIKVRTSHKLLWLDFLQYLHNNIQLMPNSNMAFG